MAGVRNDPLLCLSHCDADISVVCQTVPTHCPVCSADLNQNPAKIPPFRLPSPFVHSRSAPRCVLVRTTLGTFLESYTSTCDLHVGVGDSQGAVYHFNERGIHRDQHGWPQCLAVPVLTNSDAVVTNIWNAKIRECASSPQWRAENYHETNSNCYDFALSFLKLVGLEESVPCVASRVCFCEERVMPQTRLAARYVSLYRRVAERGHVVQYGEASTCL